MIEEFNLEPVEADAFWAWMKRSGNSTELSWLLQPQVGRNEPCPCRSGYKFKFCCGGAEGPQEPLHPVETAVQPWEGGRRNGGGS